MAQEQTPPAAGTTPTDPPAGTTPTNPPASASDASAQPPSEGTDLGDDGQPKTPPAEAGTDLGADDEQPKLGADGKPVDAAPPPWADYHGAPVDDKGAPAEYTDLVAPDGMPMDEALLAEATPVARELNLSKKGAQKLVDLHAKNIQLQAKRWTDHLAESKKEAMADPQIGGANYGPSVAKAKSLIAQFGDAELKKDLNTYGIGARRSMIRFLSKIATAVGETSMPPSGAGTGAVEKKPLHEILYKDT
jgi:hypothetical protein